MAERNVIQVLTIEGERWCDIANKAYGKATMMNEIIKANPDVPLYDILPGGVVLNIPVLDKVEIKTDAEFLPPWKQ
jgi:hypothetical protein